MGRHRNDDEAVVIQSEIDEYAMLSFPIIVLVTAGLMWKLPGVTPRVLVGIAALGFTVISVVSSHRRIELTPQSLRIVGLMRARRVDWADVASCDADYTSVVVWTVDGQQIRVYGFRRMLGGRLSSANRELDDVLETIEAYIPPAKEPPAIEPPAKEPPAKEPS